MKNMNLLEFEAPRIENGKLLLIAERITRAASPN